MTGVAREGRQWGGNDVAGAAGDGKGRAMMVACASHWTCSPLLSPMHRFELRIPPLALAAVCLLLIAALGWGLPAGNVVLPGQGWGALLLGVTGAAFLFGSALQFRLQRTTLNPMAPEKASTLVARGWFRVSRNPMYLGMALCLAAAVWWFGSLPGGVVLLGFCGWIQRFQILPEERVMRQRFGASYEAYTRQVRRWV